MKGINVRKLAAIATGAALLGSAVAPLVSAGTVEKTDIYNADGTPKVNIVVGSKAALSDAIWAGNLAAKIAEKAVTQKTVDVSGGAGTPGSASGVADLSNLTVDVTVGGKLTFDTTASKDLKDFLNSRSGSQAELYAGISSDTDANVLTHAVLPHLVDKSVSEKVDNNSTNPEAVEKIGIAADAKFDSTNSSIKDLVAYVEGGNFYYESVLNGTTGLNLGTTSFTTGTDDNVKIIFFGEEYQLSTATLSGTKNIKLVKSSAKEKYTEGQEIEGLVGDHKYKGKDVKVKFSQINTGSATATYQAAFELYDSEGNLIDTQTVSVGDNLRDLFKDSSNTEAMLSNLFVNTITVAPTTNLGYVEVTKGTDTLLLYDQKGYPYDSTDTTGIYPYVATIVSSGNNLQKIKIANSNEKWNSSTTPLYPTKTDQSLTGHAATTATFGNALADGTLGKGYAKVQFVGFDDIEEKSIVTMGSTVSGLDASAKGGLRFKGTGGEDHSIPFYLKLSGASTSGGTATRGAFTFDSKTIYYDMNVGATSAANDVNVIVHTADIINGRTWTISNLVTAGGTRQDFNATLSVTGTNVVDNGVASVTSAVPLDVNLSLGESFAIDGVTYKVTDLNTTSLGSSVAAMGVTVDGVLTFKTTSFSNTPPQTEGDIYNTTANGSNTEPKGKLYFTQDHVFDSNVATYNVGLQGNGSKKFYYAVYPQTTNNRLWLMLAADQIGSDDGSVIYKSKTLEFLGTNYPHDASYTEAKGIGRDFVDGTSAVGAQATSQTKDAGNATWAGYYVPQDSDFNTSAAFSNSTAYFIAEFHVGDELNVGDFNAYIDTKTGGAPGPFSLSNLTGYSTDVDFNGTPSWSLTSGTNSANNLSAGYTDRGTKAELLPSNAGYKFTMVNAAEKIEIIVSGKAVSTVVSGGEPLKGLKLNTEGTTSAGTKVTVTAVNGAACKVDVNAGSAGTCVADPDTYWAQAGVRNPIVYLDTDNPTGTNVIVGGNIVNKLASGLADKLTAPGQGRTAEVDAATGNIYVAGYTADDTVAAVKDLIDQIDGFS